MNGNDAGDYKHSSGTFLSNTKEFCKHQLAYRCGNRTACSGLSGVASGLNDYRDRNLWVVRTGVDRTKTDEPGMRCRIRDFRSAGLAGDSHPWHRGTAAGSRGHHAFHEVG